MYTILTLPQVSFFAIEHGGTSMVSLMMHILPIVLRIILNIRVKNDINLRKREVERDLESKRGKLGHAFH